MKETGNRTKLLAMFFLLAFCCILTYYFHSVLGTDIVFSHFFYIPIILAAVWWRRKGVIVAVFLGVSVLISHHLFRTDVQSIEDVFRALMLVIVSLLVARMRMHIDRAEGEKLLHVAMMDNIAEGVYLIGLDDLIIKWTNEKFARMFGYDPGEMVGKHVDIVNAPTDRTPAEVRMGIMDALMKTGEWHGEVRNIKRDGTFFWSYAEVSLFDHPEYGKVTVAVHTDITERKQAEEALRESEEKVRTLYDSSSDAIMLLDENGFYDCNDSTLKLFGCATREEFCSRHPADFSPPTQPDGTDSMTYARNNITFALKEGYKRFEHLHRRLDGTDFHAEVLLDAMVLGGKKVLQARVYDITERKQTEQEQEKLQAQLTQAQKMESVGRLAGGVAHDFNNMLSVILGHAEMTLEQMDSEHPFFDGLQEIRTAAERSADLTRQLLAFARKQTITPIVLDLNEIVESMLNMLRRLIGEDIDLSWLPGSEVWPIKVDPSQIDQILANLCVNSRDSIEDVGKITIRTENASPDEAYCADYPGFIPGEYVLLAVSDNGCGMDKETLDKIYEPFFTTKGIGKGTGLGLSTVYGIVKQNNGYIGASSEPGKGSAFSIYLPRHADKPEVVQKEDSTEPAQRGRETILLVEDEPSVMEMTTIMLERQGYIVLPASTPEESISLARKYSGEIHLLVTDVVMPEMNGLELASSLLSFYPNIRCLFMSGYTSNVIAHHGVLNEGVFFIQKPFALKNLTTKVREVLNSKSGRPGEMHE